MTQLPENYNSMENVDIWHLIQNDLFEKACEVAEEQYSRTKDLFVLRNKRLALLHLKKYQASLIELDKIIINGGGEADSDFILGGIAYWLINDQDNAIKMWLKGESCKYTDISGGIENQIFLYYAAIKKNDLKLRGNVVRKIRKISNSKKSSGFLKWGALYLLGQIDESDLRHKISMHPVLMDRENCQADFIVGLKYLNEGNIELYCEKIKKCISYGPNSYLESIYYLAKGESDFLCK